MKKTLIAALTLIVAMASCEGTTKKTQAKEKEVEVAFAVPHFNADSAYGFVSRQLSFGPRVPETKAHEMCGEWLCMQLGTYADTLIVQNFKARLYNGKTLPGKNIIASFNPKAKKRIVLASHWDSRPFADHDPDMNNWNKPIDGANDGASGTGILVETARLLSANPLNSSLGIDIILFDLEDYGIPAFDGGNYKTDSWTLGSEYWSANPHKFGYRANFGILLDMVGAPNPVFPKEYYSHHYAAWWCDKVWKKAREIGYGEYFPTRIGPAINDDHLPMNTIANIPTIDIIHLVENSPNGTFYEHWHTLGDNISQIDSNTLKMVGELICNVIYNEQVR